MTKSLLDGETIAARIIENAEKSRQGQNQIATFEAKQELAQIKAQMTKTFEEFQIAKKNEADDLEQYSEQAKADIKEIKA